MFIALDRRILAGRFTPFHTINRTYETGIKRTKRTKETGNQGRKTESRIYFFRGINQPEIKNQSQS